MIIIDCRMIISAGDEFYSSVKVNILPNIDWEWWRLGYMGKLFCRILLCFYYVLFVSFSNTRLPSNKLLCNQHMVKTVENQSQQIDFYHDLSATVS